MQTGRKVVTKTVRGGFILVRSIAAFTLAGMATAAVVLLLSAPSLNRLCSGAASPGFWPECATSSGLMLAILIGLPVVFFIAGKVHGVQSLLAHSTGELQRPLAAWMASRSIGYADRRGIDLAALGQDRRAQAVVRYLKTLDDQPLVRRWVGRAVLKRVDASGAITQFVTEQPLDRLSREQVTDLMAGRFEAMIESQKPEPSLTLLWVLLAAAAALVAGLRFGLGA